MNSYEKLLELAKKENITVIDYPFESKRFGGLCCDDTIGISSKLVTPEEKACVLAEELGHYLTTSGNIIDLTVPENAWQEAVARIWGYTHLVSRESIRESMHNGCKTIAESAEYLGVTTDYLLKAMSVLQMIEENPDLFS